LNKFTKLLYGFLYLGLTLVVASTDTVAQENKDGLQETHKFYLGGGIGYSSIDTGVSGTTGTAVLDEDDTGFKALLGYQLHENLAVEGFYANLGEASLTGNNGDNFVFGGTAYQFTASGSLTIKASTIGVGVVGMVPVNEMLSPIVKLGLHSWEADATVVSSTVGSATASDSGTDLFYGIGAQFNFNEKIASRAMFERFNLDDVSVDLFSVSLIFKF
jgi:OOP family OmpA-OmpF porin